MYTVKFPMVAAAGLAALITGLLHLTAQEPPPPAPGAQGRGGGRAARPAGGSSDKFSQFIRPLASQDVLLRGKTLYDANCAGCHAADMRGAIGKGNNLLRSPVAMDDRHGEL